MAYDIQKTYDYATGNIPKRFQCLTEEQLSSAPSNVPAPTAGGPAPTSAPVTGDVDGTQPATMSEILNKDVNKEAASVNQVDEESIVTEKLDPAIKAQMDSEIKQAITASKMENAQAPKPQAPVASGIPMNAMTGGGGNRQPQMPMRPSADRSMDYSNNQPAPRQLGIPTMGDPRSNQPMAPQPNMQNYAPGMNIPMYQFTPQRGRK